MKHLLIFIIPLLLVNCTPKSYELEVTYQDGKSESIRVTSNYYPTLNDGCIYFGSGGTDDDAMRCGVKSFTYKEVTKHVE